VKYYLITSACSSIITTVGSKYVQENKILISENALHSPAARHLHGLSPVEMMKIFH
jgi:hypothetical protein